jgi:hypothetical protein
VIQNPVLRGFEPDRVILRVGDDHYIDGGAERDAEEWIGRPRGAGDRPST